MAKIVFITGGASSGKTAHALKLASEHEGPRLYLATAEPLDKEMHQRIDAHKKEREGMGFDTIETTVDVAGALGGLDMGEDKKFNVVLLDCLTLWLSNVMGAALDVEAEGGKLLRALKSYEGTVYVVSNEVGMGIVPDNELSRSYRDKAGWINALIAGAADEAWMTVSGLPLRLK